MIASRHHWGHTAERSERMQMARNSSSASGPSSLRKAGGISFGPGAYIQRILPIDAFSSSMVNGGIFRAPFLDLVSFFKAWFTFLSFLVKVRRLTFA